MRKLWIYISTIVFLVVLDQWSKHAVASSFYRGESVTVIKGFFNLTYVHNSGAAFGFGGGYHDALRFLLFKALPVLACIWLLVLMVKSLKGPLMMTWAYTLILGGAIGNLIDRFRLDYVVDFFDFYYGTSHFATFNVADSAISVAAGLLIFDFFLQKKAEKDLEDPISE